ncbi:PAS domain S-box protein [Rhizobium sp. TH2]|uniref:sensor histidine kinase n=1 Tax=Rhizobium sp. TH2 TaxID=2775403 RepID=UPI0021579E50|nr:PAS domain S-box protein [Rhizobium sp. TH2]UVC07604.1 PAS domain S-box protein [Rhizobium sp. TH2]
MSVSVQPAEEVVHTLASRQSGIGALASADQSILDAIPAAVYVCAGDGTILRYNRHAAELWGRVPTPGDINDRFSGAFRHHHVDGRRLPHDETPVAAILHSGVPMHGQEIVIERPDGTRRTVLADIEALRDAHGNITGAVNCFRDITARKHAEDDLLRSQQDLEDFFDNGAVGLHLVSSDGTILRANRAELDLLGYAAEDYVGRKIMEFHIDEPVIEDILRRLSAGERLDRYPARLRASDGSIKHVQITSNVHFGEGEFLNTRCFTVDVTKELEAQATLLERSHHAREILDALPAALYTTDSEGRITYFNEAAVEFSGRRPELGNDSWCVTWQLYEPDGTPLPHDECPMAVSLKEGRPVRGAEAIAERPDGTRVPFIPFPTPLRDSSGAVTGAVNMLVDISERKRAEEEQRTLIHELNHRVKNTLATVQAIAAQTLRTTSDPAAFAEKLQGRIQALSSAHDLLTQSRWVGLAIDDLLAAELQPYGDLDSGRFEISGESVVLEPRIAPVLGMVLHELATNAAKYGALSVLPGKVQLGWSVSDGKTPRLRLRWREVGGPPVATPRVPGFGTRIIESSITRDLRGKVTFDFAPGGLDCQMEFPLT